MFVFYLLLTLTSSGKSNKPSSLLTFSKLLEFYLEEYGGSYIGASSDLPDPTEDALMSGFERVILTSSPLQDLFMRMRRIAHWENPSRSLAWLVTYLVLVYYDYIAGAGVCLSVSQCQN